jgi:hypothetical protein
MLSSTADVVKVFIVAALMAFWLGDVAAQSIEKERADVPEPAAVSARGVRYQAPPFTRLYGLPHNGGYVEAIDERTGLRIWIVRVAGRQLSDGKEQDKQDVFITRLELEANGAHLLVVDERGQQHRLDLRTRRVVHLPVSGALSK